MSTRSKLNSEEVKEQAVWTKTDEKALVTFLQTQVASDGANYKQQVWTAAANAMPNPPERGAQKSAASCKSKWQRVCG